MTGLVVGSFLNGVASNYFFYRPSLNKEGLQVLGLGGLQGTVVCIASLAMARFAMKKVEKSGYKYLTWSTFLTTGSLCAVILTVATRVLMNRIGIPMSHKEAFCNSALSIALGLCTSFYFDNDGDY